MSGPGKRARLVRSLTGTRMCRVTHSTAKLTRVRRRERIRSFVTCRARSCNAQSLQSALQPGQGEAQIVADDMDGHVQRFGSFFGSKSAEVAHLDQPRKQSVFSSEFIDRRVQTPRDLCCREIAGLPSRWSVRPRIVSALPCFLHNQQEPAASPAKRSQGSAPCLRTGVRRPQKVSDKLREQEQWSEACDFAFRPIGAGKRSDAVPGKAWE